jgi:hypothetical protein
METNLMARCFETFLENESVMIQTAQLIREGVAAGTLTGE